MADVGAELYDKISMDMADFVTSDKQMVALNKKIAIGTATHADTAKYARRLGDYTTKTLQKYLTVENLPDGKLYYNIAQSTVGKVLKSNHESVNLYGQRVQKLLNDQAGIGLNPVDGTINQERIDALVSYLADCEDLEYARELMDAPVKNIVEKYVDELIKANADFHYVSGLQPVIIRTADPGCCPWCQALQGEHPYPVKNDDVFRRHERCRCVVTYHPRKTHGIHKNQMQDVWTKDWSKEDLRSFNL